MNGARELSAIQPSLVASLHFLARDPKYDTVKPYTVRFDPKGKFPHTNIQNVKHDVKLFNLRLVLESSSEQITWDRHGFQVIKTHNDMTYEDFNDEHILGAVHIPHVLSRLQTKLRAKNVYFLNYTASRHVTISAEQWINSFLRYERETARFLSILGSGMDTDSPLREST